jgi:hypothetical protein
MRLWRQCHSITGAGIRKASQGSEDSQCSTAHVVCLLSLETWSRISIASNHITQCLLASPGGGMAPGEVEVRRGSFASIPRSTAQVRFTPESCRHSGHRATSEKCH